MYCNTIQVEGALLAVYLKLELYGHEICQDKMCEELKWFVSFCAIIQYYATMSMVVSHPCHRQSTSVLLLVTAVEVDHAREEDKARVRRE